MLFSFIKKAIVIVLCFLCFSSIKAQDDSYHNALGIRGGLGTSGITFKRFQFPPTGVIEGIVGFNLNNDRMFSITGLYEYHLFLSYRMNLYAGAGLSVAFNKNDFELPIETIIGIEYNVETFPINFSLDYKPAYRLFDKQLVWNEFAVSVRYFMDSVLR